MEVLLAGLDESAVSKSTIDNVDHSLLLLPSLLLPQVLQ
jgi:hypothetical protein